MGFTQVDTDIERRWVEEHEKYSSFRRKCIEMQGNMDNTCPKRMEDADSIAFRKNDTVQNNQCLLTEDVLDLVASHVGEMGLIYKVSHDVSLLVWEKS